MKITDEAVEAFTQYRRSQVAELRPWQPGDDVSGVSVSAEDAKAGSPKSGDMIARNPKNHADQWLVAAAYFADNFEPLAALSHLSQGAPTAADIRLKIALWSDDEGLELSMRQGDELARGIISALSPAPVGVTGGVQDAKEIIAKLEPASTLIDELSDEELFADRSNENPNVGKLAPHEPKTCATEGCERKAVVRFERGGVGSVYCSECYLKVQAIPAPTDTQEGVSEAGEVVAYGEVLSGKVETVRIDKSRHFTEPLVRQSALTACQQEVETLREGIKEIAEREQSIRENWVRYEESTKARIHELEADLILRARKLHRLTDALTPSRETKAAYMGEFHMGITLMHNGDEDHRRVMIPWTSIKEIMAAIRARAVLGGRSNE